MASNRFWMVPEDSSAARIPLPGTTIFRATFDNCSRFIVLLPSRSKAACRLDALASFVLAASGAARPVEAPASCLAQRLYSRERLALKPFEKGATRRRDVSELPRDAGPVERRDRVAAAADRGELAGSRQGGGFARERDGALLEWGELEGADGPVPDEGGDIVQLGLDRHDRPRPDVEDHLGGL